MLWLCFVQKNANTTAKVGAHDHIALRTLSVLRQQRIVTLRFALFTFFFELLNDGARVGRKNSARNYCAVRFDAFPKIVSVTPHRWKFRVVVMRFPYVNALILRAADDKFTVMTKACSYLTANVDITCNKI